MDGVKRFVVLLLLAFVACTNERPLPAVSTSDDLKKPQEGGTVVRRLQGDIATLVSQYARVLVGRRHAGAAVPGTAGWNAGERCAVGRGFRLHVPLQQRRIQILPKKIAGVF